MAFGVLDHSKGTVNFATTHDETFTLNASATVLYVGVVWQVTPTITSVVWDQGGTNQAMTSIASAAAGGGTGKVELFKLLAPTTGNKLLRVTFSGLPGGGDNVYWVSFGESDTTNGNRTTTSRTDADGSGPGLTDGNYTTGDIELHLALTVATTIAFDAGETAQSDNNITGSGYSGGLSYKTTSGTVGCTDQSFYAEVATAVIPGGGGGSGSDTGIVQMVESSANLIRITVPEETT